MRRRRWPMKQQQSTVKDPSSFPVTPPVTTLQNKGRARAAKKTGCLGAPLLPRKETADAWIGLDVGDRQVDVHVLDAQGLTLSVEVEAATAEGMAALAARHRGGHAVLEACGHSAWMQRTLQEHGWTVLVVKSDVLGGKSGRRRKSDRRDAHELAEMLRTNSRRLVAVAHRPAEAQRDLTLIMARDVLVATRTKMTNCVRGIVKTAGARLPACSAESFVTKAAQEIPAELRAATKPLVRVIAETTKQIRDYDRKIAGLLKKYVAAQRLAQVPGVGAVTAAAYVLVLWQRERFRKARDVGAMVGLVPHERSSGDSRPELGISKAGSPLLRRLLVQCAHYIIVRGADCDLKRWALARINRGGKAARKIAAVAVARRLAVVLMALWKSGRDYDPDYAQKLKTSRPDAVKSVA